MSQNPLILGGDLLSPSSLVGLQKSSLCLGQSRLCSLWRERGKKDNLHLSLDTDIHLLDPLQSRCASEMLFLVHLGVKN